MLVVGCVVLDVQDREGQGLQGQAVLKIPVINGIVEYAILERFCRILGAMVKAGVPLPEG
jgi:type IV pilus assembly protein PilC